MTSNEAPPLFVSIGAGTNQVPIIKEARKLGFQLIGVDRDPFAPGLKLCDMKIHESVLNAKEIYSKMMEFLILGDVKGVLSRSYGKSIKTVAYLAKILQQPYLPPEMVNTFINKSDMKRVFVKHGIITPAWRLVTAGNANNVATKMKFPLVAKPLTGHGKHHVSLVYTPEELRHLVTSAARSNTRFLLEEYIAGDEIIVIGIVHKGIFYTVDISDKIRSPRPYFTDRIHILPSVYSHKIKELTDIGQTITDAFSIESSPLVIELIIDHNDTPFVIEAVPEFGGEFLADIAIPDRTGYNIFEQVIRSITGMKFTPPPAPRVSPVVTVKYLFGGGGSLASFNELKATGRKGLLYTRIFKQKGDKLSEPKTNHDRLGVIITRGSTVDETIAKSNRALEKMDIVLE